MMDRNNIRPKDRPHELPASSMIAAVDRGAWCCWIVLLEELLFYCVHRVDCEEIRQGRKVFNGWDALVLTWTGTHDHRITRPTHGVASPPWSVPRYHVCAWYFLPWVISTNAFVLRYGNYPWLLCPRPGYPYQSQLSLSFPKGVWYSTS